ncbi:unnamed protein product [Arabidopsis lyrata]|uniref:Uncharacterized protein n=1 Tax=Arabidopsis lyrata subsp. lyrata TaxID=81972 RepID=D7LQP3_ARALL|nr:defensin-like protein 294 [Arabidopsis lyrata subsp. lyrata]EFH51506.1 hypothetical protein ARALYDRAFT_904692 [Arabidopsis lyrata subsp. lyrata]CAH8266678.1 unnamed protein product [Arabidopsis lyrata]|eukprot:XP_002875247.1 defensin-like protein 294 [Arabidopsis lyrata subsp. lyrata]
MASRATSLFIFFFLISCTFMLLETNASRNEHSSNLPLCTFKLNCSGIWCPEKIEKHNCIRWTCGFSEDCDKFVRCEKNAGPVCFEGICNCTQ